MKDSIQKKEHVSNLLPSENLPLHQKRLEHLVKILEKQVGKEYIADYYINKISKDVPTIVVQREGYFEVAKCLKEHEELQFEYLSDLHGTDFQTHFEVYVYLYSFSTKQAVALKVLIDQEKPCIPSLSTIWEGANWPECEVFDLLGIEFSNHPDLKRILLGEEWVGYPLRKEYKDPDTEV